MTDSEMLEWCQQYLLLIKRNFDDCGHATNLTMEFYDSEGMWHIIDTKSLREGINTAVKYFDTK